MTPSDVERLIQLAGEATPGPWQSDTTTEGDDPVVYTARVLEGGEEYAHVLFEGDWASEVDAVLVAAMRSLALPLAQDWLRLSAWHDATVPIIAALAIYGEAASLPALVAKARELNEAPSLSAPETK